MGKNDFLFDVKTHHEMNTSRLFIGGIADGTMICVPDLESAQIPVPAELPKSERYTKRMIVTGNAEFIFYASETISIEEAISKLLLSYENHAL